MQDERQLVVPGRYETIEQIREFIVRAAESSGLDSHAVFHVKLAVDEACANIVEHAYGGLDGGDIHIACGVESVPEGNFFVVRLEDQGKPFDPDSIPPPNLTADPDELRVGGLGLHFMRQIMDRVEFHFHPGRNELVMYKKIEPGADPAAPAVWQRPLHRGIWLVGVKDGRLDHTSVPPLESTLTQLLTAGHTRLVVDLSRANYINSSGLRVLASAWRTARQRGGDVHLCGLNDRLTEIFQMVGFQQIFQMHPTPADAANAIVESLND